MLDKTLAEYNNGVKIKKLENKKRKIANDIKELEKECAVKLKQLKKLTEDVKEIKKKTLRKEVLEVVEFLQERFEKIPCFNTRNVLSDSLETIYDKNGIQVDYACGYEYVEIFGITQEEFEHIEEIIDG